jgi:DNA-binding response OmpR family regulator
MSASVIKVLLIEDVPKHARQMRDMLQEYRGTKFELDWVDSFEVGLQRIPVFQPDVLLLDLAVAISRGSSTVPELQHIAPYLPVIILSSLDDEDSALKAVHQGAQDYLVQGEINTHLLLRSIRYAIERKRAGLWP